MPDATKGRLERMAEAMRPAVALIAAERERQMVEEGWSERYDDSHGDAQLARAAACYAMPDWMRAKYVDGWPWDAQWWKPTPNDRIRELTKAGALIVAEVERLQRAAIAAEEVPRG